MILSDSGRAVHGIQRQCTYRGITDIINRVKKTMTNVGLSMICYTVLQKIIKSSLRRIPVKRAHGKVIVFTKMNGKLRLKVAE